MAILKNTSIVGTTPYVDIPTGNTFNRSEPIVTVESFTSVGTTTWTCPTGVYSVEVLVVAGGGGGGIAHGGGGGGGGGLIFKPNFQVVPSTVYTVTVGAGGTSGASLPTNGGNSVFGTLTAIGGGAGGSETAPREGTAGGSGGGGSGYSTATAAGAGTAGQGFAGGRGSYRNDTGATYGSGAGGGGAGQPGQDGSEGLDAIASAGNGGEGLYYGHIFGTSFGDGGWFAGGGGGGYYGASFDGIGRGGRGGGGNGASGTSTLLAATAGAANTGGGGGGSPGTATPRNGAAGGSGIVLIRYKKFSDDANHTGEIRFNTDLQDLEIYDPTVEGWISRDPKKNFAGHNLLTRSEEFSSPWTLSRATVTTNTAVSPNGTNTAAKLAEDSNSGTHGIVANVSVTAGSLYCFSIYAKAAERSWLAIRADNQSNWNYYNLSTGTLGTTSTLNSTQADIKAAGNGWYRCVFSYIPSGVGNEPEIYLATGDGTNSYTGSTGSGVLIWGAQLELDTRVPGPYTKTISADAPKPGLINGWRIHKYITTGTSSFVPACSGEVEVLVVGGGGGGGADDPGGGGAGGLIHQITFPVKSMRTYTVTVGAGGAGAPNDTTYGANGGNSVFGPLTAIGGGAGGSGDTTESEGKFGGSGGGGAGDGAPYLPGPGVFGQGNRGGTMSVTIRGAGGGGAGSPGGGCNDFGGRGGAGLGIDITGELVYYAGGGGGGNTNSESGGTSPLGAGGAGGIGGGGNGGFAVPDGATSPLLAGTANTGGGGGAGTYNGGSTYPGGAGGSGIVVVRYRCQ